MSLSRRNIRRSKVVGLQKEAPAPLKRRCATTQAQSTEEDAVELGWWDLGPRPNDDGDVDLRALGGNCVSLRETGRTRRR